jgi:hypothetical protein
VEEGCFAGTGFTRQKDVFVGISDIIKGQIALGISRNGHALGVVND